MKALLISIHFPPLLGMASRRMACCANGLVSAGYEVDVLTVEPAEHHPVYWTDAGELKLVNPAVHIHRIPMGVLNRWAARLAVGNHCHSESNNHHNNPSGMFAGKLYRARDLWQPFAIPDASIDWFPRAVEKATSLLKRKRHRLVVSHGNPNTCHLVAYHSVGYGRAHLVADYGDAWGTNAMLDHLPGWRRRIDQFLESRFLRRVDAVTTSSQGIADGIRQRYGLPRAKLFVVPSHFVDLDQYKAIPRTAKPRLSIVYTGNIHYGTQDLRRLLEATAPFVGKLELIFAGQVDAQLAGLITSTDLKRMVEWKGPVGHQAVMELQRNASVLLLAGLRGSKQVPAKLYEYFAAGRPILCMAYEADDPAAALIKKHHRGLVVSDTPEQIAQAIRELLELHGNGQLESRFFLGDIPEYSMSCATANFLRAVLS